MKVAFVHNFCTHYTRPTFERLSELVPVDYYFFSEGEEWYWQSELGAITGAFNYEYLPGFHIGRTRVTPSLIARLLKTDYDAYIKCINGRFALPLTYLVSRLRRKPFILRTGIWMRIQTPLHKLIFPLTRYIYRRADAHVVYGEHTKRYLISEGVEPSRIFVAPHAVENEHYGRVVSDQEKETLRERLQIAPDQRVILFAGRLEEVKGAKYLLKAFSDIQDTTATLVFVGTGSERSALTNYSRELGVADRVRFVGHVSPAELVSFYSISYCLVVPSVTTKRGNELWGLVVNEAFNQGVPVIATTAVGAAAGALIIDQKNGLIVPERDAGALTKALDRLLVDRELHKVLCANARSAICNWTPQRMAEAFFAAIQFAISARSDAINSEPSTRGSHQESANLKAGA